MRVTELNVKAIKLAELFPPELILLGLVGRSPRQIVEEMTGRLVAVGMIPISCEVPLVKLVLDRETVGSTALGRGVAFPHCRTDLVPSHLGAIAIVSRGVDFGALDRQPVQIVFLIIAPLACEPQHVQIMGSVRTLAHEEYLCRKLRRSREPGQVMRVLSEFDTIFS